MSKNVAVPIYCIMVYYRAMHSIDKECSLDRQRATVRWHTIIIQMECSQLLGVFVQNDILYRDQGAKVHLFRSFEFRVEIPFNGFRRVIYGFRVFHGIL